MKTNLIVAAICSCCLPFLACSSTKVNNYPVPEVELAKYLGHWYEIARYDHWFERKMTNTTADYDMTCEGTIQVTNMGWKNGKRKVSIGKAVLTGTPGLLRVSFFGPFFSDYRILMLTPDYNTAVVGSGSAEYLWILSRAPYLMPETKEQVLRELDRRGYDDSKLNWVDQAENEHNFLHEPYK